MQPQGPNMYAPPGAPQQHPMNAYPCARCGGPGADYFPPNAPPMHRQCAGLEPDVLAWPWLMVAYAVTVPLGCSFIGAVFASIPYYLWRAKYPLRAKRYNMHVWIAFAISCLLWGGIVVMGSMASKK